MGDRRIIPFAHQNSLSKAQTPHLQSFSILRFHRSFLATMHSFSTLLLPALATVATAEVFKFPLANGFPDVSDSGIQALAQIAGGPIPQSSSGGGTTALPPAGLQALQGLAFNEASEVAFFTQLLQNITVSRR